MSQVRVGKWGKSLAIRVPLDVARTSGLSDGEAVEIETLDGDILIRRRAAKAEARFAQTDYAIIPSHHQLATWAMRKGIRYEARTDEWSLAWLFTKQ